MRLLLFYFLYILYSCSGSLSNSQNPDINQRSSQGESLLDIDSLFLDTPKILKAGSDYVLRATDPSDHIYFGKNFAPYKIELYNVAEIERVMDSLIEKSKASGFFVNRSLKSYKYQIFSVKTSEKKIRIRVQAFCVEEAGKLQWNSSRVTIKDGGECFFSIIYDLIDREVISFQINGDA